MAPGATAVRGRICRQTEPMPQYFAERPEAPHRPGVVELTVAGRRLALASDSGVFSAGRIDQGTAVLLETVPAPPGSGDLLDLGCGYGPLALALAVRAPGATVWAVDVNARARELTGANARAAGLGNVRVCHPDEVPAGLRFRAIWSNPPIRPGKEELHAMLVGWLSRLAGDGTAYLVVQRHLGADSLQRWLSEHGWPTARVRSRKGYRVLECRREGSVR